MPDYLITQGTNRVVLRNYEGVITTYTEPKDYVSDCQCEDCKAAKRWKVWRHYLMDSIWQSSLRTYREKRERASNLKMPFIDEILKYRTLAIIGMEKIPVRLSVLTIF